MREILASEITAQIKRAFIEAAYVIGGDVLRSLEEHAALEPSPTGRAVLEQIVQNDRIAARERLPMCQDTGMAVVFAQLGQEVHVAGGDYAQAIQQGVREAYQEGYLRKSVVKEPLYDRSNTGDNTPAVLYTDVVPGDQLRFEITAKGFGSENMSRIKMLTPADGEQGVVDFIVETVSLAGPNPCPPVILGVCVGGTMDKAAQLAKRATMRPLDQPNPDPRYADLERRTLERINRLGIGPGGLGGGTTALAVNIEWFPTHIAGLPVAVNICCHAARHCSVTL